MFFLLDTPFFPKNTILVQQYVCRAPYLTIPNSIYQFFPQISPHKPCKKVKGMLYHNIPFTNNISKNCGFNPKTGLIRRIFFRNNITSLHIIYNIKAPSKVNRFLFLFCYSIVYFTQSLKAVLHTISNRFISSGSREKAYPRRQQHAIK